MTIRELLGAIEDLCAVVEELPADADISAVQLDGMGFGSVRKALFLEGDIGAAAAVFGVSQLEVRAFPEFNKVYFNVGGVGIVQYRKKCADEETP